MFGRISANELKENKKRQSAFWEDHKTVYYQGVINQVHLTFSSQKSNNKAELPEGKQDISQEYEEVKDTSSTLVHLKS